MPTVPNTAAPSDGALPSTDVWSLFVESFDVFSVVLIVGSVAAVAIIARLVLEARRSVIAPEEPAARIDAALDAGDPGEALAIAQEEGGIAGDAVVAAHAARGLAAPRRCAKRRTRGERGVRALDAAAGSAPGDRGARPAGRARGGRCGG